MKPGADLKSKNRGMLDFTTLAQCIKVTGVPDMIAPPAVHVAHFTTLQLVITLLSSDKQQLNVE